MMRGANRHHLIPSGRHDALLDFGDTVEAARWAATSRPRTSGTSSRDMGGGSAQRTKHVAGLSPTATAVRATRVRSRRSECKLRSRACCERCFGSSALRGRTVCVIGLGHVGSRVAKLCARCRCTGLWITDVDERKRDLADQLGGRWVSPERAIEADVDVLAPCALGGLLDDETAPRLRCRIPWRARPHNPARRRVDRRSPRIASTSCGRPISSSMPAA